MRVARRGAPQRTGRPKTCTKQRARRTGRQCADRCAQRRAGNFVGVRAQAIRSTSSRRRVLGRFIQVSTACDAAKRSAPSHRRRTAPLSRLAGVEARSISLLFQGRHIPRAGCAHLARRTLAPGEGGRLVGRAGMSAGFCRALSAASSGKALRLWLWAAAACTTLWLESGWLNIQLRFPSHTHPTCASRSTPSPATASGTQGATVRPSPCVLPEVLTLNNRV